MKVKIGDREVDVSKAFPLSIGDWVDMEAQGLLAEDGSFNAGIANTFGLIKTVVAKCDVSEEEARSIPFDQIQGLIAYIVEQIGGVDDPTQDGSQNSST